MLDQSAPEVELLRAAYAAFNARDADATLVTMTSDVTLPNEMEGGSVHGHQAARAYWTRQWLVIHPHDEPIFSLEGFWRNLSGCTSDRARSSWNRPFRSAPWSSLYH